MNKKKLLKIIISAIILIGLYITKLRFGIDNFINGLIQCAGYSIVFLSTIFFLSKYQSRKYKSHIQSKILDLSKYAGCKVIKNKEELQKWKQDVLDSID